MRLVRLLPCFLGSMIASCTSTSAFRFGLSDLQQQLDSQPPLFTDADIAELEALAPQLPTPFRLGVAPPISLELDDRYDWRRQGGNVQRASFGTWDADEAAVIEEWGRRFREAGIVSELVLLPRMLVQGSSTEQAEMLPAMRRAAARHHVDAVLVVNRVSASQSHRGLFSLLDITIAGMFIIPSYEVSSMSVMEAALVDTRNGYLYASARGDGSIERHSPAVQTEESMAKGQAQARVAALRDLGEDLFAQAIGAPPAASPPVRRARPSGPGPARGRESCSDGPRRRRSMPADVEREAHLRRSHRARAVPARDPLGARGRSLRGPRHEQRGDCRAVPPRRARAPRPLRPPPLHSPAPAAGSARCPGGRPRRRGCDRAVRGRERRDDPAPRLARARTRPGRSRLPTRWARARTAVEERLPRLPRPAARQPRDGGRARARLGGTAAAPPMARADRRGVVGLRRGGRLGLHARAGRGGAARERALDRERRARLEREARRAVRPSPRRRGPALDARGRARRVPRRRARVRTLGLGAIRLPLRADRRRPVEPRPRGRARPDPRARARARAVRPLQLAARPGRARDRARGRRAGRGPGRARGLRQEDRRAALGQPAAQPELQLAGLRHARGRAAGPDRERGVALGALARGRAPPVGAPL